MKASLKSVILNMFFVVCIALALFGCGSTPSARAVRTIPITDSIIKEVGGVDNTPKFQYYISKEITLKLVTGESETTIVEGQLMRRSATARESVIIGANLPGLVKGYDTRELRGLTGLTLNLGYRLDVAFENMDGDPYIRFVSSGDGNDQKYVIQYTDRNAKAINYGGINYTVNYSGSEPPYLLIRMQESASDTERSRRATGLTLE